MRRCEACRAVSFKRDAEFCTKCGHPFDDGSMNDTIQDGIEIMGTDNLVKATRIWISIVRKTGNPSDEDYEAMVKSTADCIIRQIPDAKYYSRGGIGDLARDLDRYGRTYTKDLMEALHGALPLIRSRRQIWRLSAEYMYLVFDSFNAYPNLQTMIQILRKASKDMADFQDAIPKLTGREKNEATEIAFYKEYSSEMADRINQRMCEEGREKTATALQFWIEQDVLVYGPQAVDAASAASKYYTAKKRTATRRDAKNSELKAFLDSYYEIPFKLRKSV